MTLILLLISWIAHVLGYQQLNYPRNIYIVCLILHNKIYVRRTCSIFWLRMSSVSAPTLHVHLTYTSRTPHVHFTYISRTPHVHFTYTSRAPHVHLTYTSRTLHVHFTYTLRTAHVHLTYTLRVHLTYT